MEFMTAMTEPKFYWGNISPPCTAAPRRSRLVAVTAWIVLNSNPALAAYAIGAPEQEEEGFKAHVDESMTWDDNLFRLPDGQKPADGGPRSTRLNQTSA